MTLTDWLVECGEGRKGVAGEVMQPDVGIKGRLSCG
jgi:hypothetical protein